MTKTALLIPLSISMVILNTFVQSIHAETNSEQLEAVTVTAEVSDADKVKQVDGHRVAASEGAQLISGSYIHAQQATTLADALRKTTSVQVDEEAGQQGNLIFIRGFTQDQVSVRVEGAPKSFNQVRHGGAGTIWLEPDMYRDIVIVPGVASNVYGNGSLGGVILLETKDPEDIIKSDRNWGLSLRSGMESNARSVYVSMDSARRITDQLALSGTFVSRNTKQYKDGNGDKALLGATGTDDTNWLVKAVITPDDSQRIEASYLGLRKEYTARTTTGSGAYRDPSATDVDDDTFTLQYKINPVSNDWIDLSARISQANTERTRLDLGATTPAIWGVKTTYIELQNRSTIFQTDNLIHRLRYGVDHTFDDVVTAYSSSTSGNSIKRERKQTGFYLSDTLLFGENLEVTASVRFDSYKNNSDLGQSIKEKGTSPKLAFNWKPFEASSMKGLSIFAVIGKGFRTPSTHEAFGRGDGLPSCGRSSCSEVLPNDNLKGESSESWEAGIRFNRRGVFSDNDEFSFQAGYISNKVDDFIASIQVGEYTADIDGDGQPDLVEINQFINLNKADIHGVELSFNYTSETWFAAVTAQNIDGKDDQGVKLADISPASLNVSVGAYLFSGKSRVGVDMTSRKKREFVQRSRGRRRDGYNIIDLFASYQFSEHVSLQLRVENVADKTYSKRTIVELDGEDLTTYAPGRNFKVTAQYTF